jgi:hypothetical protein
MSSHMTLETVPFGDSQSYFQGGQSSVLGRSGMNFRPSNTGNNSIQSLGSADIDNNPELLKIC